MNRENIQQVRDLISALPPEKFDMKEPSTNGCGTPACIMGWAEVLMQPNPEDWRHFTIREVGEWIGLKRPDAFALFVPSADIDFSPYDATPAEAVRVLDHLLATGEVDWSIASQEVA